MMAPFALSRLTTSASCPHGQRLCQLSSLSSAFRSLEKMSKRVTGNAIAHILDNTILQRIASRSRLHSQIRVSRDIVLDEDWDTVQR